MQNFLRKVFGVYAGEGKNIFRFARLAIIWAFGTSIAETLAISSFIEKIGASYLPLCYMLIAISLIGLSCLFIYLLRSTSCEKLFIHILQNAAIFYTSALGIMLTNPGNWFWFILQAATYVIVAALIAIYWTFLDHYHDLQEAKRIYSLYNGAYYLGCVFSGFFINSFIKITGPLFFYSLIPIALFTSIFEIKRITKKTNPIEEDTIDDVFSEGKKGVFSILQLFYKSPFAIFVVATSLIVQLIRTCTEFCYMDTFDKVFHHAATISSGMATQEVISGFLGKCKAFISLGNIILGMFFYRRFVRSIGITNLILIPSIFFILLYSEWSINTGLWVAVLGVIAVEGILFTLEDNNFNLLTSAAPFKLRGAMRIINDSFFEPIGMLFSSLFLLALQSASKWYGLALAVLFFITSFCIRQLYAKSIFLNLKYNAIHFEKKVAHWFSSLNKKERKETKEKIVKFLHSDDEKIKLLSIESLIHLQDSKVVTDLLYYANQLSEDGKIAVIQLLDNSLFSQDSKITEMIQSWADNFASFELLKWCNLYLAKRGLIYPEKVKKDLDSEDLFLRAIAIIALKKSLANQSPNVGLNQTIAYKELDLLLNLNNDVEISMGLDILSIDKSNESIEKVISFLNHESFFVKRNAAKALSKLVDKTSYRYGAKILQCLKTSSDNIFRIYCLHALGRIKDSTTVKDILLASIFFRPNEKRLTESIILNMGLKTVPVLIAVIKDSHLHDRSRILASKILGLLALPQLKAIIADIIYIEIEKAYFYYYYSNSIPKNYPLYDLELLQNTLHSSYQSTIDFIIYLLGAAGSIEDCDLLVKALHGKNPKEHANAIETLEKSCNRRIFRQIHPLLSDIPKEAKLDACKKMTIKKLSLLELLDQLEHSTSISNKTVTAHLKATLKMPNWKQSLREQIKTSEEPFHNFAYELLEL